VRRTRAQRRRLCGPSPPRSERPSTKHSTPIPTRPTATRRPPYYTAIADIRHCHCLCRPAALAKPLSPTHACRRATTSLPPTLCLLLHSCLQDANIRSSRLNDLIALKAPPPAPLRPLLPAGQCRKHKTTPIHGPHQVTYNPTHRPNPPPADPSARGGASRATVPWPNQHHPASLLELPRPMLADTLATTQSSHSLLRSLLMARLRQRSGHRLARISEGGPLSTLKLDIGSLARLLVLAAWER
jgi:hypothetical protein